MKKFKSIICIILFVCLLFTTAYAFPNSIWKPLEEYNLAMSNGDDARMYELGMQLINIMENEADSQEKTDFLAGKYEQLSKCAERLGYINEAVELYKKYIPYGKLMNWTDGVKSAESKIDALVPSLDVYVTDSTYYPEYFGAKFEPKRGVYFGSAYDNDPRINDFNNALVSQYFPKKNSDYLIYLDYGEDVETLGRYQRYFEDAKKNNIGVMFAWNTNYQIDAQSDAEYIKRTIDYISSFGIPIFLRFGAEMNVSSIGDNADAYIKSFRYVADYAHTKSNIAVVWSPNDIGGLDKPFEMFYPGDEYVDWIGVSHYVIKYFQGIKDHGSLTDVQDTYFATGEYANSLLRIKQIMNFIEKNNINKPVMLSECGVSHTLRLENENASAWAQIQLTRIYSELIKKYQNIKMINYFNVLRESEPYAFELFSDSALNTKYNELVSNGYFLSDISSESGFGYRPFQSGHQIESGSEISVVGYYPKSLYSNVRISANGQQLNYLSAPPFTAKINLPAGNYNFKFEFIDNGIVLASQEINADVVNEINVLLNGEKIQFADQKPVAENGRTLVPVRGVFEKMGMQVEWHGESQTVIIKNDDYEISLVLGSTVLNVNGKEIEMDTSAKVINNRTMLPLRYVSEALDAKVDWDGNTNTVIITK